MATIALSVQEYNDLRVQAAIRTAPRHTNPVEPAGQGVVRARAIHPLGNPHPAREFETGLYDARTREGARRGGRPRIHGSQREAQAAAARAYRARRKARP
jgi:hypothetical protein